MQVASYVLLCAASLAVLAYPMLIFAGVMGLSAKVQGRASLYSVLFLSFIALSLAYPLPLLLGWKLARQAARAGSSSETLYAAIPLCYLAVLALLFFVVLRMEGKIYARPRSK